MATEMKLTPQEVTLPEKRIFIVRRYKPTAEPGDPHGVEEIAVAAHSVAVDESGALSFISFIVWEGQVMPQKHRIFSMYIDVEEKVEFKSALLTH